MREKRERQQKIAQGKEDFFFYQILRKDLSIKNLGQSTVIVKSNLSPVTLWRFFGRRRKNFFKKDSCMSHVAIKQQKLSRDSKKMKIELRSVRPDARRKSHSFCEAQIRL